MDHNSHAEARDWDELKRIGYEHEDLEVRGIIKSMTILGIFTVGSILAAYKIFAYLNEGAFNQPDPKAAFSRTAPKAPNPLLQTNITTKTDIRDLRMHEREVLENWGPADADHIRVPIDRAIDLVLQKGLVKGQPTGVVVGK